MLKREDEVFSNIGLKDRQQKIDHESKRLPKQYQETELSILANQIGERETTNNPFGLKNDFYTHRIRAHEPELKQSQKNWDYRFSPEFSDFQLVLDQLAKTITKYCSSSHRLTRNGAIIPDYLKKCYKDLPKDQISIK